MNKSAMPPERIEKELNKILRRAVIDIPEPPLAKEYIVNIHSDSILDSQKKEILNLIKIARYDSLLLMIDDFIIFCSKNDLSFDPKLTGMTQFAERPYVSLVRMGVEYKRVKSGEVNNG